MIGSTLPLEQNTDQHIDSWKDWLNSESRIGAVHFFSSVDGTTASITQFNNIIDLLKTTGKQIWVSIDANKDMPNYNAENPTALKVDPFLIDTDTLPTKTTAAINAINNRLPDITKASIEFNAHIGSGGYSRWILGYSYPSILQDPINKSINPTLAEMKKAASFMPAVLAANKLAFQQMIEVPFEREAYIHKDNLTKADMLNWIKENNVTITIGRGAWVLDANLEEHYTNYKIVEDARSPLLVHKDKYLAGDFPYQYYRDYLAEANFYSGIGYHKGIKRDNADSLMAAGYKGTWFRNITPEKTEFAAYKIRKDREA